MIGLVKIILPLAALGAAAWLGSMTARKSYFIPRAKLQATIDGHRAFLIDATKERLDRSHVEAGLQDYVDRSLGGDLQTVDHRLRSRLNRLGEAVGLNGLTVVTGHATGRQSPAKGQFKRRGIQRELRAEIDFVELQGSISGEGTLEQVLGLTHRIQAEPWLKKIEHLKIDPRDNGTRFGVTMRLKTLFLPGRSPTEPNLDAPEPADFDRYASLVDTNPFAVPAPPPGPKPASPEPASPTAQQAFPYARWVLTGVAEAAPGAEVWLLDRKSGESRRLLVGESLHRMVFVAARGDRAEFQLEQERLSVVVGQNLSEGTAIRE